jgi:hypothetical protein
MLQPKRKVWLRNCIVGAVLLILVFIFILGTQPSFVANGADFLRTIIGDQAVAKLETVLFQIQDFIQQTKYKTGLLAPANPWQNIASNTNPIPENSNNATTTKNKQPNKGVWQPQPLKHLGNIEGEGNWLPYITDSSGKTVAYRTFLSPDPKRPYITVAVVAFDLNQTRLHYVLGFNEPHEPGYSRGTGIMPETDKTAGVLLAMFNGGFKAAQGHFGAMANGVLALPPRDGLGTLAIYQDGHIKIGAWGNDIQPSPDMQSWRQNGPLVVQNGQINPRVYINSADDWGYTVNGDTPTWRSAVGISQDDQTLFYFAGPGLIMDRLAKNITDTGAAEAIQLDINNYWVLFTAVHYDKGEMKLDPLLPNMGVYNTDRYLHHSGRDFFYVTSKP